MGQSFTDEAQMSSLPGNACPGVAAGSISGYTTVGSRGRVGYLRLSDWDGSCNSGSSEGKDDCEEAHGKLAVRIW